MKKFTFGRSLVLEIISEIGSSSEKEHIIPILNDSP